MPKPTAPTLKLVCTRLLLEQLQAAERALRRSKTWPRTNLGELQSLIIRVSEARAGLVPSTPPPPAPRAGEILPLDVG